ncbi:hypothetical protein ECG_04216 [Echinococcus granulosus]|uniref:Expressed protein n=1 Tax=Echinococcus granulosus TaxID=6210 RepID=A0A068WBN3_ECHGR|nr:hypothetical protein ECG_04216 [Echinococcus granulosus]CDS17502.1 expressed protein [Echinococcus granulosus]
MGLESLKNLPVFHEQNFKNYVPYRLSSQPRITYINTKHRTPATPHVSQQRNDSTDESNQKRGLSEQVSDGQCTPNDNPGNTPSKQRKID